MIDLTRQLNLTQIAFGITVIAFVLVVFVMPGGKK